MQVAGEPFPAIRALAASTVDQAQRATSPMFLDHQCIDEK
jgi:hypothetical protein